VASKCASQACRATRYTHIYLTVQKYISLFVLGIITYRRNWFLGISDAVGKLWLWIAIACIVLLPVIFVAGGVMEGKVDVFKGGAHWQAAVTALWESFLCMGMVGGALFCPRLLYPETAARQKGLVRSTSRPGLCHGRMLEEKTSVSHT
jgi:hypothetical protein